MVQTIIAGIIGVLLGFGVGQAVQNDTPTTSGTETLTLAEDTMLQEDFDTPLASDFVSVRPGIEQLATEELSGEEVAGLLFMREEEKLARDVYLTLYEQWELPIFSNIAQSEQTHTEAVRQLIEKYGLVDPVTDDALGVFANEELQDLYNQLVEEGSDSITAALRVGATIEDLDIKDLDEQLALTDNADITMVYENLQRGSRNHLRSFTTQLKRLGPTYEPQYISIEEYEDIVSTSRETGGGNGRGWSNGRSGSNGGGN